MSLVTKPDDFCCEPASDCGSRLPSAENVLSTFSDADLLDAWSRDGHPTALGALVERYSVMVLSVCRRRCRSEADAEDAFQTTFLYLGRNSSKIRRPECLAGWLHRVAQRAALATLKVNHREHEPMVDPPADPDDPLDRLTQRHEAIVLDEELADLPEHYRSAIVMHLYEGHAIQSLAEHFGTSAGSIRGRLQRGKQLLAQRLRRRGVIPVMAFAAANAWTVTSSQATRAGELVIQATGSGDLPDPPIDTPLLESLLAQGVRLMPSLYTATGLLAGSALIALMMMTDGTQGQNAPAKTVMSFPASGTPIVGQFAAESSEASETVADEESPRKRRQKKNNADELAHESMEPAQGVPEYGGLGDMMGAGMSAIGGGGLGVGMDDSRLRAPKAVVPAPSSRIALEVMGALDRESDFQIATTLKYLPKELHESFGIPVLIDDRGVAFAKQKVDTAEVAFADSSVPLSTALRRMLRPLGLKAVVEDEGLVITADVAELMQQGIGTSHWINVDQNAEAKIAATLDAETNFEFVELPLNDAIELISEQHDLAILLDRRAMEEVGLSAEEPVSIMVNKVMLRNALSLLLRDFDLTYTVYGESLVVTTTEASDQNLLNRIYWLEGTGFAVGDYQSVINLVQSSIIPDAWEALGGTSTIAPVVSTRPALLVSTSYAIHQQIDTLLQTLRDTHFGNDPVLEESRLPAKPTPPTVGGGGMF